jgi:hypothetical protein
MTNTLSVKERVEVATAVTGEQHYETQFPNNDVKIISIPYEKWCMMNWVERTNFIWWPAFNPAGKPGLMTSWECRSQALALVEWLADKVGSFEYQDYAEDILKLIRAKDISALESIAHSMLESK